MLRSRLKRGQILEDDLVQVGFHGECLPVSQVLLEVSPPDVANAPQSSLDDQQTPNTEPEDATSLNSSRYASPGSVSVTAESTTAEVDDPAAPREPAQQVVAATSPDESSRVVQIKRPNSRISSPGSFAPNKSLWKQAAALVGGEDRLWKGVMTAVSLLLLMWWWRQPPSAGTIYGEFTRCHQKAEELRHKQLKPGEWSVAIAKDRARIQSLVDGLQKRAKASRPAEQQLLWAGKKGLLKSLESSLDSAEAEKLFATHMRLAEQILYPQRNKLT